MKPAPCYLLGYIFIFLLQAESSDEDRTQWSFSFPESIKAPKNSDVTIPCTFTAPIDHNPTNLIWYKYEDLVSIQIFNSKNPSKVIEEYRGRTSLVDNGTNNCSLTIKDVTETEWFYPGISEKINSYILNNSRGVLVTVESSDEDRTQWSFSFPDSIKVLKNSDVTIPCTFTAPIDLSEVSLIWYKYHLTGYPQVFNSKDPSQVIEEYRGRTSLVANGTNSCSLRIKDVRETEQFYPGINKEINSYKINNSQQVRVKVTGCSEDGSCEDWKFTFPSIIGALKGSCVDIPCTFTHPKDAKDFNFFWYLKRNQAKIFNNKTPSDVAEKYKGRTFLTGNTENNCSIKIINVEKTESYYPGINIDINSNTLKNEDVFVYVAVADRPPEPLISGTENMEDKKTVNISCAVNHTCPSHPPTLTWNITGHPISENHEALPIRGKWRMESRMTYTASYTDDKTDLQCAATFPNNKTSVKIITLNIKYRPRSVIISVDHNKSTQEGDDVMLLCSSKANPPVNNYTWYRIGPGGKFSHGHGDKIFVKNTTTDKYICAATNDMGTEESSVFEFTNQPGYERRILYAGIGTGVGLVFIIVLIVLFCICRRKRKTSVLKVKNEEKTQQEAIPMDDHLYGNVDQQQRAIRRESSSELQDSSHIYSNADSEQSNIIKNTKEGQTADSDGVIYSLLELPTPGESPQQPTTTLETEYAVVKH
ncbi:uncharacterized protein LOC143933370 [Lithobates pipiens]